MLGRWQIRVESSGNFGSPGNLKAGAELQFSWIAALVFMLINHRKSKDI